MSSKVRFEDEADAEYRDAGRWYEDRRSGLGVEFFDEVGAVVRLILDLPRSGERVPQELAGHGELGLTQRYMHLNPAALDAAIRLLDGRGNIVATGVR